MYLDDAKLETVYSGGIQKVIDVLNQSSGNGPMEAVAMKVLVMTGMLGMSHVCVCVFVCVCVCVCLHCMLLLHF